VNNVPAGYNSKPSSIFGTDPNDTVTTIVISKKIIFIAPPIQFMPRAAVYGGPTGVVGHFSR
jgi:hypothetical protein